MAIAASALPRVLYVTYPDDSPTRQTGVRQSVALFNWADEPRMLAVRRDRLGQAGPVTVENFWTDQRETWSEEYLARPLAPRSAMLYDVLDES